MHCPGGAAARLVPVAAALLLAACGGPGDRAGDAAQQEPAPAVIDSALPPAEALRRFRVGLDSTAALDGPSSRGALLRAFGTAVAARDTAALLRLAINRREFAYLVYPVSKLSRPPFRQAPDIAWLMLQNASHGGLRKLLQRAGEITVMGHSCPDAFEVDGSLRTVSGCVTRVRTREGTERNLQLVGRIIELRGRWKIVGYDGDL